MFPRPLGAGIALSLVLCASARAQTPGAGSTHTEAVVTTRATGTFEVKMTPQADTGEFAVGRMTGDKVLHGDLEGTGKGQMLGFMNQALASGGYVALERITGTLHGRRGSFMLQHSTTMVRGVPHQSIMVVPDSGTDQLVGLSGSLTIIITNGQHSYEFDYTIAP